MQRLIVNILAAIGAVAVLGLLTSLITQPETTPTTVPADLEAAMAAVPTVREMPSGSSAGAPLAGPELRALSGQLLKVANPRMTESLGDAYWEAVATVENTTDRPIAKFTQISCRLFDETGATVALADGYASVEAQILPGEIVATKVRGEVAPPRQITRFACDFK